MRSVGGTRALGQQILLDGTVDLPGRFKAFSRDAPSSASVIHSDRAYSLPLSLKLVYGVSRILSG